MTKESEWEQLSAFQNDNGRAYQIEIICRNDRPEILLKIKKQSLPGWIQIYDRTDWKHSSKHGVYAILNEIWDLIERDAEITPVISGSLWQYEDVEGF